MRDDFQKQIEFEEFTFKYDPDRSLAEHKMGYIGKTFINSTASQSVATYRHSSFGGVGEIEFHYKSEWGTTYMQIFIDGERMPLTTLEQTTDERWSTISLSNVLFSHGETVILLQTVQNASLVLDKLIIKDTLMMINLCYCPYS